MEIMKREIQRKQTGKSVIDQFVMDEDYNVPDSKRDVERIIVTEGKVKIEEVKPVENYLRVIGKLKFQILYVGEGIEPTLCSLEGELPFEEMVYTDELDSTYEIKSTRVEMQAMMIHSRKLRFKTMIELEVISQKLVTEEIPIDVESNVKIYKKKIPMDLLKLEMSKNDMYRIREEITLSGTKETIGAILWTDVSNRKLDTKLGTDELEISGELLVFCFYESPEGKIDWLEQIVPYHGNVECYGAEVNMYHQMNTELEDIMIEARMDEDGEMRVLGVEGTLKMHIEIYEEEKMEALKDVYSLEKQCKLTERLTLPELKNDILQICHSNAFVQVDKVVCEQEGVRVEGVLHISFLYVKANDEVPFETWQGMVPFSYLIECNHATENMHFHISSMLEQLSVGLLGGDEIEIKAVLAFHCFFKKMVCHQMMDNLKLEPLDMKELEKRPSVIGYIVKEDDELWDLAKRYSTTVDNIIQVNELVDEKMKIGERILIFKDNMSIL